MLQKREAGVYRPRWGRMKCTTKSEMGTMLSKCRSPVGLWVAMYKERGGRNEHGC